MTHLSLFSGIGGLDLAAEMAGFTTVGQVEIDDYCNRVLEYHWPEVLRWRDVKDVTAESFEERTGIKPGTLALLSGGFPCQPVSAAGKREGDKDERWLWDEMLRVICEIRPCWVVAENVRGLLSIKSHGDGRHLFGRVLCDLAENGYRVGWLCYGAGDVGAPHKRERVFIVAYSNSMGSQVRWGGGNKCMERGCEEGQEAAFIGSAASEPSGINVADANIVHREQCRSPGRMGRERKPDQGDGRGQRPTQPRLGMLSARISDGLAGHRWPAGWWPTPKTGSNRNSRQAIIDEKGGGKHKSDLSLMQAVEVVSGILPKELKSPDELPPQWRQQWPAGPGEQHPWEPPRIATGVKDRVAKLKALGNAVVPAQAYPIFRAIAEIQEVGL